jgi:hypothetical protein
VTGKVADVVLADYHHYTELRTELATLADSYPNTSRQVKMLLVITERLSRLYVLGQTVEGRDLAVIQISEAVLEDRRLLKPMVKLIANMHGNEPVGREVLLALARCTTLCMEHPLVVIYCISECTFKSGHRLVSTALHFQVSAAEQRP